MSVEPEEPTPRVIWDIRREGRSWSSAEMDLRRSVRPDRNEVIEGRLYWTEEDRLNMLALLLENVGADRAVRLGDPEVWKQAVAALGAERGDKSADPPRDSA